VYKRQDCDRNELLDQREILLEDDLVLMYDDGEIIGLPQQREDDLEQTLVIEIQRVEEDFELEGGDEEGIMVYTYIRATGYRGVPLRVAVFYYNEDDEPLSGENAVADNRSRSGYLTIQTVIEPDYEDTEWDGFWFWMPYSSFPDQSRRRVTARVQAQLGVEGEGFTAFSELVEFELVRR
jgi:hypothetical protein